MTDKKPDANLWEGRKNSAANWFASLRDELCTKLESLEPEGAKFERKPWRRGDG